MDSTPASTSSGEAVKVRLFGREYGVRGQGNKKYLEKLADFINERSEEIRRNTHVVSTLDLVVLTLLNITDEMFRHQQEKDQTIKELEAKTEKLLKAIDRAV